MTIAIGYMGPRVPQRQQSQQKKRRPPPEMAPHELASANSFAPPAGHDDVAPLRNEQQRAEIASLDQAMQAAETAVALTQRAVQGLAAADQCLARLHQSLSQAILDPAGETLRKRVLEIGALLKQLDRLGAETRFGEQSLLDGGLSPKGDASGEGLAFISAWPQARSSPADGYVVTVTSPPLRARLKGERALTAELLRTPMRLRVQEGERYAELRTSGGEGYVQVCAALSRALRANGLELHVVETPERHLLIQHDRYGPGHAFWAESHPPGILSRRDGKPGLARDGRHIAGKIHGEPADGRGELLFGKPDNRFTAGLCVSFTGPLPAWFAELAARGPEARQRPLMEGITVGKVSLVQRGLTFRFDPADLDGVRLQLPCVRPAALARRVTNGSGFDSLAAIRMESVREARDALRLAERAMREVREARARTENVLNTRLLAHLNALRVKIEHLNAGASTIGDAALADRLARYIGVRLEDDRTLARVAQVNPQPGAVMKLIN